MNHAIFISDIIGTIDDGQREVCATADANYDLEKSKVVVDLDAFVRRTPPQGQGVHEPESWLPAAEHVTETMPREDAGTFAKDVFGSWIRKVRASVPEQLHLRT